MAAYVTGTATGPGAIDALILAFNTQIVANGWINVDTISSVVGSRDLVWRTTLLNANAQNSCYLRLRQTALTTLQWNLYTDWDATTHVGINETATFAAQTTLQDASFTYWIRANGYSVAICCFIGSLYYKGYAGYYRRHLPASRAGMTKTSQAYAAGNSTLNVVSNATGTLQAGQRVMIYNFAHSSASANAANAEVLTIQSIVTGLITFTSPTTKAYDLGAVIGENACPAIITGAWYSNSTMAGVTGYRPFALDGTRVSSTSHTVTFLQAIFGLETASDPGDINLEYAPGLIVLSSAESLKTGFLGTLYSWECCAGGAQVVGDIMDDGDNTYIVLGNNTPTDCMIMGPQ